MMIVWYKHRQVLSNKSRKKDVKRSLSEERLNSPAGCGRVVCGSQGVVSAETSSRWYLTLT